MDGVVNSHEFNEQVKRTVRETLRRQHSQVQTRNRWHKRSGGAGESSSGSCQCCTLISSGDIAHPDLPAGANITSSEWTMKSICGDTLGAITVKSSDGKGKVTWTPASHPLLEYASSDDNFDETITTGLSAETWAGTDVTGTTSFTATLEMDWSTTPCRVRLTLDGTLAIMPTIDFEFENRDINRIGGVTARAAQIPNEVVSMSNCEVCLTPNVVAASCSHVTSPQTFIRLDYNPASFTFETEESNNFTHTGSTNYSATAWNATGRETLQCWVPAKALMTGYEQLITVGNCRWSMKIADEYTDVKFRREYVDADSYSGVSCSSSSDNTPTCLLIPDKAGSQTLETAHGQTEGFDPYIGADGALIHTNTLANSTFNLPAGAHPSWTEIDLNSNVDTGSVHAYWRLIVSSSTITLSLITQAVVMSKYEVKYTSGGHAIQDEWVIRPGGTDAAFEPYHFDSRSMFIGSTLGSWSQSVTTHLGNSRLLDSNGLFSSRGTISNITDTLDPLGGGALVDTPSHTITWTKSITAPITGTHTLTRQSHSGNIITGSPSTIDVTF